MKSIPYFMNPLKTSHLLTPLVPNHRHTTLRQQVRTIILRVHTSIPSSTIPTTPNICLFVSLYTKTLFLSPSIPLTFSLFRSLQSSLFLLSQGFISLIFLIPLSHFSCIPLSGWKWRMISRNEIFLRREISYWNHLKSRRNHPWRRQLVTALSESVFRRWMPGKDVRRDMKIRSGLDLILSIFPLLSFTMLLLFVFCFFNEWCFLF